MSKDLVPVRPPTRGCEQTPERRDFHFIDQVAKKGRLGEDFRVEEPRCGLEWDGRQLFQPMKPARRMDVQQRESEDQAPGE
jgi:hypothetical protein